MAEKDTVFGSKIKYSGIFDFADFYKFCYDYLSDEKGYSMKETKYVEKLEGNAKKIEFDWKGGKKFTDYFKGELGVSFKIMGLTPVEVNQGGKKVQTNKGTVEISIKGTLIRDYEHKFESTAFKKFLRAIYEKFVITSRIDEYVGTTAGDGDSFLSQAKAYLDLEGKK